MDDPAGLAGPGADAERLGAVPVPAAGTSYAASGSGVYPADARYANMCPPAPSPIQAEAAFGSLQVMPILLMADGTLMTQSRDWH
jgi:hypothetical protein